MILELVDTLQEQFLVNIFQFYHLYCEELVQPIQLQNWNQLEPKILLLMHIHCLTKIVN